MVADMQRLQDPFYPERFRSYSGVYDSKRLRGTEDTKPWDLNNELLRLIGKEHQILDIGCGTATKIIPLSKHVSGITGLEPNPDMRARAKENLCRSGVTNIEIIKGCADDLPFQDKSFDIVTSMLAPHNVAEIARVLKDDGIAVVERVGDRDKWSIKEPFGSDRDGLRGYMAHLEEGELPILCETEFRKFFRNVSVKNGFWNTYYPSIDDVILLCEQTPTVRDFDKETDRAALDQIEHLYSTERGIVTQQNRVLIIAQGLIR